MVSKHFSQAIDDAVVTQDITTVEAFLSLLDRYDSGGSVNRPYQRNNERDHLTAENSNRWEIRRDTRPSNSQNIIQRPLQDREKISTSNAQHRPQDNTRNPAYERRGYNEPRTSTAR
ncbi:hypothetical protein KPH14_013043, partial [Odynerus spinipes]